VQILNPIQPKAFEMEPERLKAEFGGRLTFYGGVDTQYILPNGTPAEVCAEVRRLVRILGRNGGYILSPAHVFQEDVPAANILALYQAGRECGRE
jgi:uroporphyrinogen decarboxylase